LVQVPANCKTVYTSSILVVASTLQINDLDRIHHQKINGVLDRGRLPGAEADRDQRLVVWSNLPHVCDGRPR